MKKLMLALWMLAGISLSAQVLPLNGTLPVLFSTYDSSTGALTNADSTPTCAAYIAGSSSSVYSANAVNMSTGKYRWSAVLSVANGFAVGNAYRVSCNATVSSLAGEIDKGTVYIVLAELAAGTPRIDVKTINNTAQTAGDLAARLPAALTTDGNIKSDSLRINGQLTSASGTITFPTSIASPINITGGTITTATNVTHLGIGTIGASTITSDAVTKIQTGLYTFQRNVAGQKFTIALFDATTGNPKPSATGFSCSISKDYGSFAGITAPTEVAHGFYYLSPSQAETDANDILVYCTATGARDFQALLSAQH